MANLIAGGLKSLGQHMGVSGADNTVIIAEYTRTEGLKMYTNSKAPHDWGELKFKSDAHRAGFKWRC